MFFSKCGPNGSKNKTYIIRTIFMVNVFSVFLYKVYQGFRLNLDKSSKMIIFGSLLTALNLSDNFWSGSVFTWNELEPKIKPSNQLTVYTCVYFYETYEGCEGGKHFSNNSTVGFNNKRLVKLTSGQSVLSQSPRSDGRLCRCNKAISSEQL